VKKSFDKYIADYGLSLTKLCYSLCSNRHDAEDLYQSTWEKAMKKIKLYNKDKPFEKWLFAICINTYRDSHRRFDSKKILNFSNSEEQHRFLSSIPDFSFDKDEYIALHQAVSKLPYELREIIVLYYFRDYSIKELSEILSIAQGTAKSRLYTAREILKKELNYE